MELGNRWSLRGETALVTGGSKGIGCAIVEELARFGAAVHTCARNEAELKQSLQKWRDLKLQVTGSVCDVSSSEEREKLIKEVSTIFNGKLNILVNNAASGHIKPVLEVTQEEYKHTMNINLEAGFHLSQLAHPLLKASGRGNIVFISSITSLQGNSFMSVYGASKGAMNQLTRGLACEWAKDNIRTNCVAPGLINTPMAKSVASSSRLFWSVSRPEIMIGGIQWSSPDSCSSLGAMYQLSRCLACEWDKDNICTNCVAPSVINVDG
ncbi:hypothetical protein ZIOFF_013023 [Zingiber officinale]|uniref:Ketoreductase domain-containing protein n=1 Tax=Zingiber officinale TaxID=94328 RepID=A0A8J5LNN3_ZINOF|nr:hypothetical protein ZIOFF_013023 [Zingiber officinale]